jgi:DNA-binding PadR family transcriptional regulator
MSLLVNTDSAEFKFLLEETGATKGNLSVQLNKLKDAGYIEIIKGYKGNYPHTSCAITEKGKDAFEEYVNAIEQYLNMKK